jgi:tripartite-type tricarboxylate transporter receptor subunit TctC
MMLARHRLLALAVLVFPAAATSVASAETVEEFYRANRVTVAIGSGVGGSHDLNARIIARHIGRFLPGMPTVISQNVPGAGSVKLANHLYSGAPKDGSMIGALNRGGVFEALYAEPGKARSKFDPLKFNWLGAPDRISSVAIVWHTSKIKSHKDLATHTAVFGSSGGTTTTVPLILQRLVGYKFKIVQGYKSGGDVDLAIERGEIEGRGATAWGGMKSRHADWLKEKKVRMLFQTGLTKHPELQDVPLALDFAPNPEARKVMALFFAAEDIGYPYVAPPGLAADRLKALRDGFALTLKDSRYVADARKQGLDINPVSWQRMTEVITDSFTAPEALKDRLRRSVAYDKGTKKKTKKKKE